MRLKFENMKFFLKLSQKSWIRFFDARVRQFWSVFFRASIDALGASKKNTEILCLISFYFKTLAMEMKDEGESYLSSSSSSSSLSNLVNTNMHQGVELKDEDTEEDSDSSSSSSSSSSSNEVEIRQFKTSADFINYAQQAMQSFI